MNAVGMEWVTPGLPRMVFYNYSNSIKKSDVLLNNGVWWLSGRVLDSGLRGCGFEPHWRYCIVSLSKTLYPLLSTGSTQEDLSQHD